MGQGGPDAINLIPLELAAPRAVDMVGGSTGLPIAGGN